METVPEARGECGKKGDEDKTRGRGVKLSGSSVPEDPCDDGWGDPLRPSTREREIPKKKGTPRVRRPPVTTVVLPSARRTKAAPHLTAPSCDLLSKRGF